VGVKFAEFCPFGNGREGGRGSNEHNNSARGTGETHVLGARAIDKQMALLVAISLGFTFDRILGALFVDDEASKEI
jgi:hypothetical protein